MLAFAILKALVVVVKLDAVVVGLEDVSEEFVAIENTAGGDGGLRLLKACNS